MPTRERNSVTYRKAGRSRGGTSSNCAWSERCQTKIRYCDNKPRGTTLSGSAPGSILERLGSFRHACEAMVERPRLGAWEFGATNGLGVCLTSSRTVFLLHSIVRRSGRTGIGGTLRKFHVQDPFWYFPAFGATFIL